MAATRPWHKWSRGQFSVFAFGMLGLTLLLFGTTRLFPDFAIVGQVLAWATIGVSVFVGTSWAKRFDANRFESRDLP